MSRYYRASVSITKPNPGLEGGRIDRRDELLSDLLPMFSKNRSLLVSACGCAEDEKSL